MELEITQLEEKTNLIKHYESATIKNILQIGKLLKEINEDGSYKVTHESFVKYVESNFSFKKSYAYSFIQLYEKYGESFQRLEKIKELGGMRFVLLSIKEEDDHIDEVVKKVEDKSIPMSQLGKEVKRLKDQAGTEPSYSSSVDEFDLKLIRQANGLEAFRDNLIIGLENWLVGAKKSSNQEILKFKEQFSKLLERLK